MTRHASSAYVRRTVGDKRSRSEIQRTLTQAFEKLLGIPAKPDKKNKPIRSK